MPNIPQIINIAKVCQYLVDERQAGRVLFNTPNANPLLSANLYRIRKSVEWAYNQDNDYPNIQAVGFYLLGLCQYIGEAEAIINGGNSGTPIVPGTPTGFEFVSIPYTVTEDNVTSFQTDDLIGGNNLAFIVYNDQLLTLAKNEFSVNYTTGTINFSTVTLFIDDTLTCSFNKKL